MSSSLPGDVVAIVKLLNASLSRLDVVKWSELESMLATLEHVVGELDKSIKSECSVKIGTASPVSLRPTETSQ